MKDKKLAVILGVLLFVLLTITYVSRSKTSNQAPKWSKTDKVEQTNKSEEGKVPVKINKEAGEEVQTKNNTFVITDTGITPQTVVIKTGGSVVFNNKTNKVQKVKVKGDLWGPITLEPNKSSSVTLESLGSFLLYVDSHADDPNFQAKLTAEE